MNISPWGDILDVAGAFRIHAGRIFISEQRKSWLTPSRLAGDNMSTPLLHRKHTRTLLIFGFFRTPDGVALHSSSQSISGVTLDEVRSTL
jgi:hypothetical protein